MMTPKVCYKSVLLCKRAVVFLFLIHIHVKFVKEHNPSAQVS